MQIYCADFTCNIQLLHQVPWYFRTKIEHTLMQCDYQLVKVAKYVPDLTVVVLSLYSCYASCAALAVPVQILCWVYQGYVWPLHLQLCACKQYFFNTLAQVICNNACIHREFNFSMSSGALVTLVKQKVIGKFCMSIFVDYVVQMWKTRWCSYSYQHTAKFYDPKVMVCWGVTLFTLVGR